MTLDWKKFDDAVPTEPRSVVTYGGHGGALLLYEGRSMRQGDGVLTEGWTSELESVWCRPDIEDDGEDWWRQSAENREWTHWAYVDPPEEA